MRFSLGLSTLALGLSGAGYGATVAVIDSGVDVRHRDLAPLIRANPHEIADNGTDDDGNGFIDDVYGWNFADNNAKVLDYELLNTFHADCEKFFEIQGKTLLGTATDEEKAWLEAKRGDMMFLRELQTFGSFVHGSHVTGIATGSRTVERAFAVKIIPTKRGGGIGSYAGPLDIEAARRAIAEAEATDPLTDMLLKFFLNTIVEQQAPVIQKAIAYAGQQGADVANGSFGVGGAAAKTLVDTMLKLLLGRDPTAEESAEYVSYLITKIAERCRTAVEGAPATLFVFAAGNDGTDNDVTPVAPAGTKAPNVVAVAATLSLSKLASFSNWGAQTVDVAAPGVVIRSTIPGDRYMALSGTSMASPEVADTALLVRDANPALDPAATKKILMGTVDAKEWLKSKVASGGIVNRARAVEAARLSRTMPVADAIAAAKTSIADQSEPLEAETLDDSMIYALPLPSPLH